MKLRSDRTPEPGAFLVMDAALAAARAAGRSITNLSVGSSDLPPPQEALDALAASIQDPITHRYCLKSGTMPLLRAATAWFAATYGVTLDPASQALSLVGSQEGLAHMLLALTDPGDTMLLPSVAYPSYFGAMQIAGIKPAYIPLLPGSHLPDFDALTQQQLAQASVLLLNYPNNPTGVAVDDAFWARVLALCENHDLLLIHDAPYVGQVYDRVAASSPLALPGGVERCVELHSFAKSYQLGGFRLGFALGNAAALASLEAVKAAVDFNSYLGIQRMGVACLQLPAQRVREYARVWQSRAEALVAALAAQQHQWQIAQPRACMYVWAKLPRELDGVMDDLQFCQQLVAETGLALSPGQGFGPGGVGHVRFALVQPVEVLTAAAQTLGAFVERLVAQRASGAAAAGSGDSGGHS